MAVSDGKNRMTRFDRQAYEHLMSTLRSGSVSPTRRDMMRWSAIASGALATASFGVIGAGAAGTPRGTAAPRRYQDDEVQTDVEISVPFDPFGQDVTLDPHRTTNSGAFWVMFPNVWGGLLRYTETGQVETDLAETFTVSDDGTVYTFKIRSDATYANGNQVIADHFVTSWKRALDPSITSPMAAFMQHVEGYAEYICRRERGDRLRGCRRRDRRDHLEPAGQLLPLVPGSLRLERRRSVRDRSPGGDRIRPRGCRHRTVALHRVRSDHAVRHGAEHQPLSGQFPLACSDRLADRLRPDCGQLRPDAVHR